MTVHQATRSRELVNILHAAGHSISYDSILRIDTAMGYTILKQYFDNDNVLIPHNFMSAKLPGYIRYANDNIDINEETLDGIGTFHASQTAAFRRKERNESVTHINLIRGKDRSVKVPEDFMAMQEAPIENEKQEPVFPGYVQYK